MTVSLVIKSMLISSSSSVDCCKSSSSSNGMNVLLFEVSSSISLAAYDETSMQKDLYPWKPSSKSNSGRPDSGVGKVYLKFSNDHVSTCVEYRDSILVCSSGFPFSSINFPASLRVDNKLTGELGWYKQLSKMKTCLMPLSSFKESQTVHSCRHGPVPFAVVRLLLVWWRVPGINFRMSLTGGWVVADKEDRIHVKVNLSIQFFCVAVRKRRCETMKRAERTLNILFNVFGSVWCSIISLGRQ